MGGGLSSSDLRKALEDYLRSELDETWQSGGAGREALEATIGEPGEHANPRRYEKDNGFRGPVVARAGGAATALWTTTTDPARTAGQVITIYTLIIENATGAAVTGWLEIGGIPITPPIHVANNDTVVVDFIAGLNVGDNDVNCNASANGVNFQVIGTEA